MGDKTGIEWTDATWNPTTGCDKVSPGCDNCYALKQAKRLKAMGQPDYQTDGDPTSSGPGFGLAMHPHRLDQPLRWARPRRIFVNSMSDLFHKDVTDEFIAQVFAVMARAEQHTFQILTKRHGRLRSLLSSERFYDLLVGELSLFTGGANPGLTWPLPNVWLGVSVETQQWADTRIPALLDTPAAVRFLSMEPLLGPVNLQHSLNGDPNGWRAVSALQWVIVGGESGPEARPMHPDWARSLRDQCVSAGVPFHFKQWGEWAPRAGFTDETTFRVGKRKAGRVLDGRTWDEWPLETVTVP